MTDTERNLLAAFFEACHEGGAILLSSDALRTYEAVCEKWGIEPQISDDN